MKHTLFFILILSMSSNLFAQVTSVGEAKISKVYTIVDGKTNRLKDSVNSEENIWYIKNYKPVPNGLYVDTTIWKDKYGKFVDVSVFHDRKRVFHTEIYLVNGDNIYWKYEIDKEYLKKHLR